MGFGLHRRFIAFDDTKIRYRIQKPYLETEVEQGIAEEYCCQDCGFKTPRIEVIMMHKKSHLQGVYTAICTKSKPVKAKAKKSPPKKPRRSMSNLPRTKTKTIDEDIELLRKGLSIFEDDIEPEKQKGKKLPVPVKSVQENKEEILKSILCEWDNDLDEREDEVQKTDKQKPAEQKDEEKQSSKQLDNSCFDFSEEEENEVTAAATGRKIPRVIPETKQKPEEKKDESSEFLELMETTSVPTIPEVPHLLKCEQNFRETSTVKFPDKQETADTPVASLTKNEKQEVATKLTNPKKRFVKSFEDFAARFLQQDVVETDSDSTVENKDFSSEKSTSSEKMEEEKVEEVVDSHKKEGTPTVEERVQPKPEKSELDQDKELLPAKGNISEEDNVSVENATRSSSELLEGFDLPENKSSLKLHRPSLKSSEEEPDEIVKTRTDFPSKLRRSYLKSQEKHDDVKQFEGSDDVKSLEKHDDVKDKDSEGPDDTEKLDTVVPQKDDAVDTEKHDTKGLDKYDSEKQQSDDSVLEESLSQKSRERQHTQRKENESLNVTPKDNIVLDEKCTGSSSQNSEKEAIENISLEDKIPSELPVNLLQPPQKCTTKDEDTSLEVSESKEKQLNSANQQKPPKQEQAAVDNQSVEVSKLKTQLMSKLSSPKEEKNIKRNISDVVGAVDPEASITESIQLKYNKGKYKSRVYHLSSENESNVGLHIAKKRAVTSFEDFLEKRIDETTTTSEGKSETSATSAKEALEVMKDESNIQDKENDHSKIEETHATEVISGEVPMEIETEIVPVTNFETSAPVEADISALTTLATVSELSTTLDSVSKHKPPETELIALDKNVTIVSEKELAEGQVEFANDALIKPLTLSSFSMDFSDSNSESCSVLAKETAKPYTEDDKSSSKEPVKYEDKKKTEKVDKVVKIPQQELSNFDIEERIPPAVVSTQAVENSPQKDFSVKLESKEQTSTKLLAILSDRQKKKETASVETKKLEAPPKTKVLGISSKGLIVKPQVRKVIEQPTKTAETVSVQKVSSKREYQDIEDIDTFIIHKKVPVPEVNVEPPIKPFKKMTAKPTGGKAKILQQTIITPAGDIIQPEPPHTQPQQVDDNVMFDINSMPIVMGDQIIQPENTDSLPVVIADSVALTKKSEKTLLIKKTNQQQLKMLNKTSVKSTTPAKALPAQTYVKMHPSQVKGGFKNQKFYQIGSKVVKSSPTMITQGKSGKFIIVPSGTSPGTVKTNVEKKVTITKKLSTSPKQVVTKVQNIAPEPTGNKIMIMTNQQGQQSRVLLTPAQQKMFGYQTPSSKLKSAVVKGSSIQKSIAPDITVAGSSNIAPKSVISHRQFITSSTQLMTPVAKQQIALAKPDVSKIRKTPAQGQRVVLQSVTTPPKGTTLKPSTTLKTQHSVKKLQPIDEALLDQQVQEQLQAIKASGLKSQQVKVEHKMSIKQPARKSYLKKSSVDIKQSIVTPKATSSSAVPKVSKSESSLLPPLAPISPNKKEAVLQTDTTVAVVPSAVEESKVEVQQRPLNQLIIQDTQGNQTTITEGQILALPSETVDGQPSTYMLVTLDESGNLTPLNNEALMSLDQNLGLGGDLSNMVLQLDAGSGTIQPQPVSEAVSKPTEVVAENVAENVTGSIAENIVEKQETVAPVEMEKTPGAEIAQESADASQQFYVADPVTAQKLIESLTEGNADFASLLANAENNSILIHADGQQILINANTDNQMLLTVNTDSTPEDTNNPIFAAQPSKSQDILAAALADTDVFQQEQAHMKVAQAQLSPNSALYPMNVGNVLETSLTLTSPIMTPLEVPSTNNKKIQDNETDILTQVPKNVDLPITITDPNISQTVAQQQVASLIANELQSNLELPLAISDTNIVVVTSELTSPSYSYSLPSLDDGVEMSQKSFNSSISMPLLSEDSRESSLKTGDSNQSLDKPISEESKSDETIEIKPQNETEENSQINETTEASQLNETVETSHLNETVEIPQLNETVEMSQLNETVEMSQLNETVEISQLNETVEISQLNDTVEISPLNETAEIMQSGIIESDEISEDNKADEKVKELSNCEDSNMLVEGLCTLGGEICSSLSEPPPDMFDLAVAPPEYAKSADNVPERTVSPKSEKIDSDTDAVSEDASSEMRKQENDYNSFSNCRSEGTVASDTTSDLNVDESSCEIPIQPEIITDITSKTFDLNESSQTEETLKRDSSEEEGNERKRIKVD